DGLECCRSVAESQVYLTRRGISSDTLTYQRRQWLAIAAHQLRHQQRGDHAAIAIGEVTEVMVRTHLAAIDRILSTHTLLDEGMTGLGLHSHAAALLDLLLSIPHQPRMMNDARAALFLKKRLGQQPVDVITLDK